MLAKGNLKSDVIVEREDEEEEEEEREGESETEARPAKGRGVVGQVYEDAMGDFR